MREGARVDEERTIGVPLDGLCVDDGIDLVGSDPGAEGGGGDGQDFAAKLHPAQARAKRTWLAC